MAKLRVALAKSWPSLLVLSLLGLVYVLPPDTSLGEVRGAGVLRACMPPAYPPLVTGDENAPGIDVELLRAVAREMRVELAIATNQAMGRDFNPRNWRVTRAQCQVLAGGVVASQTTRSFLDTTQAHAETGWALISPAPLDDWKDKRIGVLAGISGLDRLALSGLLRARQARVGVVQNADDLAKGLREGRFAAAVTERLLAEEIAAANGWKVEWMPAELPRYDLVFGLWKGDLTLKRAIVAALAKLGASGETRGIVARYASEAAATRGG